MSRINYFLERVQKIKWMMDDFIKQDLNVLQKGLILIDLGISIVVYGCGINDYFQYQFYKRKHIDRKSFVVYRKRMKIVRFFNDKKDREIIDDKSTFNKRFTNFLGREWLNVSEATFDEFSSFANKHGKYIVKPLDGSGGKGIRIEEIDSESDLEKTFKQLKGEKVLIEEVIVQHKELSDFNPTSINTLRVVTLLCKNGHVKVMTANLRVGNGDKHADNFHHDGIATLLDIESGIVVTSGIDMKFKRYILHPISNKQLVGFKIPYWNDVIKTVKEAAIMVPTVRYIGWDVAIGENGEIMLIEGNAAADPDISQMPDQIGKWPLYEEYIENSKLN